MVALDTKTSLIRLKQVQAQGFNCSVVKVVCQKILIFLCVHVSLDGHGEVVVSVGTC